MGHLIFCLDLIYEYFSTALTAPPSNAAEAGQRAPDDVPAEAGWDLGVSENSLCRTLFGGPYNNDPTL